MKRLMIIVPNLQGGGQERIAALTSQVLDKDYEIFFVVFGDKDSKYRISQKARYINLELPNSKGVLKKTVNVVKRTFRVEKLRKKNNIDFCLSFGWTANIVNCLSSGYGKTIVSIRNTSKMETGEKNIINNLIYKKADKILCVSEGQKEKIAEIYPKIKDRIVVIYNPCDIDMIQELIGEEKKKDNRLVTCARLESVKCYKNLFNAVKMARDVMSGIKLIVLGDGTQRNELEKYIDTNGMSQFITLAGFCDNPFKEMASGSAFVFASSREGFPNVLVEAMACGVPVISTDCPFGPREILSGKHEKKILDEYEIVENGILTPVFDEGNEHQEEKERIFASAITKMLSDDGLRGKLSENSLKKSNKFSMENYRKKFKVTLDGD